MKAQNEESKKKTLTSTVKENPLASIAIAAISSALVTFLSQTYATTGYVQAQRKDMIEYFNQKAEVLNTKAEGNRADIEKLEEKLEKMDGKLDTIKEVVIAIRRK